MADGNDFFKRMCKEAQEDLASGRKGWREADNNTLLLACFGMLSNHLAHSVTKPLWFFAGSMFCGVVGYLITRVLGG